MTGRDGAEAGGGAGADGGSDPAYPQRAAFAAGLDFDLDDFQVQGCRAVEQGRGVLVAAPTGAGKTVVGEFAVQLALTTGRKAFYTTPIKALSNQKYADLVRRHGPAKVGLLTGDSSINGEAVSYTHLDVYKRQGLGGAARRPAVTPVIAPGRGRLQDGLRRG